MANRKRKRKRGSTGVELDHASKKIKPLTGEIPDRSQLKHPTLSLYYEQISTLREYLLDALPASSRSRRRKIAAVGLQTSKYDNLPNGIARPTGTAVSKSGNKSDEFCDVISKNEANLKSLLDTTLVCTVQKGSKVNDNASLFQQAHPTDDNSFEEGMSSISEVGCCWIERLSLTSCPFECQEILAIQSSCMLKVVQR